MAFKAAEQPRREMQGERNKPWSKRDIESATLSQFSFDNFFSPDLLLTSHCLDPTVALACV
jgi:hypothetical protein